jgi:O-antigen ligase
MAGYSFGGISAAGVRTAPAFDLSGVRARERAAGSDNPRAAYAFLLAFIFLLYLNVPIVMPRFEVVHPAKLVGAAAVLALLAETLFGRRRFSFGLPEGGVLLGFLGVATLSCLTALWPGLAVQVVGDLMKIVLVYFFVANCAASVRGVRGVMWTMLLGGLVPAAGVMRNYLTGNVIEGRTGWVGLFANPNDLAYSLVILVPLAACLAVRSRLLTRLVLWGIILFFAAGIFVTFSRGGLIGLAAVIGLYAWKRRSLMTWIVIAGMAAAGLFAVAHLWTRGQDFSDLQDDATVRSRLATSEAGLAMFADHPLFGVGPGCSVVAWPLYAPPGVRTRGALITHNTFIQGLSETGITGFIAFFLFIGFGLWHAHQLARKRLPSHATPVGAHQPAAGDLDMPRPQPAEEVRALGTGLEIALWGFVVCGLSAGIMLTWFPYILVGLVSAARRIPGTP